MSEIETRTVLFAEAGESNTRRTLELAHSRMQALGIRSVVVATTRGDTGVQACEIFKDLDVVVVSHSTGFKAPGEQELTPQNRRKIEAGNARLLTTTHAFGGAGRAVRLKFGGVETEEVVANVLRMFGQGVKVAVEIALMAADAGLVRCDAPLMCIAGSGRGADTAVILKPANAQRLFEVQVLEIVCMPAAGHPGIK